MRYHRALWPNGPTHPLEASRRHGTETFQGFTLPVERREELQELIGQRAEFLAYVNCFMDRATMDAQVQKMDEPYPIRHRVTGEKIVLSGAEYLDLITLHLCDWLEQVARSDAWDYRREQYQAMAKRLGGTPLEAYNRVCAAAP